VSGRLGFPLSVQWRFRAVSRETFRQLTRREPGAKRAGNSPLDCLEPRCGLPGVQMVEPFEPSSLSTRNPRTVGLGICECWTSIRQRDPRRTRGSASVGVHCRRRPPGGGVQVQKEDPIGFGSAHVTETGVGFPLGPDSLRRRQVTGMDDLWWRRPSITIAVTFHSAQGVPGQRGNQ
jgi:hypothetical protein